MHTYDPLHEPYPSHIPSATPIYDALYSEYRRAFRALPGDRSGEEDLGFKAFGSAPGSGHTGFGSGFSGDLSIWQAGVRQRTGRHHVPAALPPAPRRGL
ncbi:hypothetical protein ACFU5O_22830 [Streptomyces sp. NPDC057445]|uniref:hypothetical protein n=1 Tax=Streptomyces sp. NPDC057445 TaxID=3346136 RepID=UPI00367EDB9B